MAYVSCRYGPPPSIPIDQQQICCLDENGTEWWMTEDSEVGDWLRFKEEAGVDDPYGERACWLPTPPPRQRSGRPSTLRAGRPTSMTARCGRLSLRRQRR